MFYPLAFILLINLFNYIYTLPQRSDTNYNKHYLNKQPLEPTVSSYTFYTAVDPTDNSDDSLASSSSTQERSTINDDSYLYPNVIKNKQLRQQQPQPQLVIQRPQQFQKPQLIDGNKRKTKKELEELEEEEIEEPDRLSLLLPQSKFNCVNKNTGYYADEDLACEVFHYCQDNNRHSWICPEGFTFHQVHLICMPPGNDNICEKSSQYHFVNDYLYKPVNLEEYQQRPNTSLRYSERYYPENYYEEDDPSQNHHKHSHRVSQSEASKVQLTDGRYKQENLIGQVYKSPNEINIPLNQRRPIYTNQKYYLRNDE